MNIIRSLRELAKQAYSGTRQEKFISRYKFQRIVADPRSTMYDNKWVGPSGNYFYQVTGYTKFYDLDTKTMLETDGVTIGVSDLKALLKGAEVTHVGDVKIVIMNSSLCTNVGLVTTLDDYALEMGSHISVISGKLVLRDPETREIILDLNSKVLDRMINITTTFIRRPIEIAGL